MLRFFYLEHVFKGLTSLTDSAGCAVFPDPALSFQQVKAMDRRQCAIFCKGD